MNISKQIKRFVGLFLSIIIVLNSSVIFNSVQNVVADPGIPSEVETFETATTDFSLESEYRDVVPYDENSIVFSIIQYRAQGMDAEYIDDTSDIAVNYGLYNVQFLYDFAVNDVEQRDGYIAYQMFYKTSTTSSDVWSLIDSIRTEELIVTAEPDYEMEIIEGIECEEVLETEAVSQSEVTFLNWIVDDLNLERVWEMITPYHAPGEGVVVAVIDTGVEYTHPDLINNMWTNTDEIPNDGIDNDHNGYIDDYYGANMISSTNNDPIDQNGHGTHVAGTIAMSSNGVGGVGIAYGARIMAVKVSGSDGRMYISDVVTAVNYAVNNGAQVINMSLGGPENSSLRSALQRASSSVVLVSSAGNDNEPTEDAPFTPSGNNYPGGYSFVIGCMAYDSNLSKAYFSNYDYIRGSGCEYEVMVPGHQIRSTYLGGGYRYLSGTSMSAPIVSAFAAILVREYSGQSATFIRNKIINSCIGTINYTAPNGVSFSYPKISIVNAVYEIFGGNDFTCSVVGHSLSLEGDIGVNFYYRLSNDLYHNPNAYVHFVLEDGTVTDIPMVDGKWSSEQGGSYVYTCDVPAKSMADIITATIIIPGGNANGTDYVGTTHQYSVKTYANYILQNSGSSSEYARAANLVRAMLTYGTYSQMYFNYRTNNLAINLNDSNAMSITNVTSSTFNRYGNYVNFRYNSLVPVGMHLDLLGETSMYVYFEMPEGDSLQDLVFVLVNDDGTFTTGENPLVTTIVDGYICVRVDNIAANDLDTLYYIGGFDSNGFIGYYKVYPLTYGYLSYSHSISSTNTESLRNLLRAMYNYNYYANSYI